MVDAEVLSILKTDLQISSSALDDYLFTLIESAKAYIQREGIVLTESRGD